jgi:hypothetical protein
MVSKSYKAALINKDDSVTTTKEVIKCGSIEVAQAKFKKIYPNVKEVVAYRLGDAFKREMRKEKGNG